MDDWLKQAKERAKSEAESFIEEMNMIAESLDLDEEWFVNEVVKNIHKMKDAKE